MPRPKKWRSVCQLPKINNFGPTNMQGDAQKIIMTVDEYETIRLIDFEKMTQEECSQSMNVARTTVQAIYEKARFKIAQSLVEGCGLVIEGGEYKLCDGRGRHCKRTGCRRF